MQGAEEIVGKTDTLHRELDVGEAIRLGLSLCRIDELSPDRFRQSTISHLVPVPASSISGVHTLNSAQGFEVVDVFGTPSLKPADLRIQSAVTT